MVLVLAGPASGSYATELQHLAERLGISSSLHCTGMLQGDQKWGAFQSADAFVLPSHQENFGIAVAEALSCFTPVLLTHPVNIAAAGAGLVEHDTVAGITTLVCRWLALDPAPALQWPWRVMDFGAGSLPWTKRLQAPPGFPLRLHFPVCQIDRAGRQHPHPCQAGLVGAC